MLLPLLWSGRQQPKLRAVSSCRLPSYRPAMIKYRSVLLLLLLAPGLHATEAGEDSKHTCRHDTCMSICMLPASARHQLQRPRFLLLLLLLVPAPPAPPTAAAGECCAGMRSLFRSSGSGVLTALCCCSLQTPKSTRRPVDVYTTTAPAAAAASTIAARLCCCCCCC